LRSFSLAGRSIVSLDGRIVFATLSLLG